jgi:hypothetical protein
LAANGAIYTSPTAAGPVYTINEKTGLLRPITVSRKKNDDGTSKQIPHIIQYQIPNRNSDYNQVVISQPVAAGTAQRGARKDDVTTLDCVVDVTVARKLAVIKGRVMLLNPNSYKVDLSARYQLVEPGDLVAVTDELAGIFAKPMRLTSVRHTKEKEVQCEADAFIYGMRSPGTVVATDPTGGGGDRGVDPGSVNPPIFLQPVQGLMKQDQPQLWIVVSNGSGHYGGCQVWISTDGGSNYHLIGVILGNAVTGYATNDWPAAADPDITNDLSVNVSESLGEIESLSVSDQDGFVYPFWIEGGSEEIPYELGAYATADLTAAYQYTLRAAASGSPLVSHKLRRAVFSAPEFGEGSDHPMTGSPLVGARFCLIDSSGQGIFKANIDQNWVDKTLYFKFCAYNEFMGNVQSLSDVTAYPYTIIQGQEDGYFLVNGE